MARPAPPSSVSRPSTVDQLYELLRQGHALTQAEMTEHLEISSKRQARRLVRTLKEAEVPIEERWRGREKEYLLPAAEWQTTDVSLTLTEREALALVLAAGAAHSGLGPAPLNEALSEAFDRLIDGLPESVDTFEPDSLLDHLHFGEAASVDVASDVFVALVDALSNRRSVRIDYHTARSDTYHEGRQIDPWALAVRGDTWLCVAHDHRSGETRDFALSRIEAVRDEDSPGADYTIPDDFDVELHFVDRFEAVDGEEAYRVRLLVEPDRAPYFRDKTYQRTQQIDEERADGRLVVSYEVVGLDEITAFVRSWGPGVTVLDPPELVERVAADARTVAARYDAPPSASSSLDASVDEVLSGTATGPPDMKRPES